LKSTGSAFHGFIRDEYTTLGETWDRILSTDVDATWEWRVFRDVEEVRKEQAQFDLAWEGARETTMRVFAEDYSASVQATMYKMSEEILEKAPGVMRVTYELPNKHYFEISKLYPGLKTMSENHSSIPQPKDEGTGLVLNRMLTVYRYGVAQRTQEHRKGRRSLCTPVWT
jgi:urate oxidase